MLQSPDFLILVSPDHFSYNDETAGSNAFQNNNSSNAEQVRADALNEFSSLLSTLDRHQVHYKIFPSAGENTPDAVFPNNWFSTHQNGEIILYPMLAVNRRAERNPKIISWITQTFGHTKINDFTPEEKENKFLEGTGSIVFHHPSKTAFSCLSPRTNEEVLDKVCRTINYHSCVFRAADLNRAKIYHTNVMLSIGSGYAIICSESIEDLLERSFVLKKLESCGLEIIHISFSQMSSFAGNMFEVINREGKKKLLMSQTAYLSLVPDQLRAIEKYAEPVYSPIPTIENYGGGSIRCMVAGIFSVKT